MISRIILVAALVVGLSFSEDLRADARVLSADFLLGDTAPDGPVDMRVLGRTDNAQPPQQRFSGKLSFDPANATTGFVAHHDPFGLTGEDGSAVRRLPEFDFEFFQHGDDVLPLRQGVLRSDHPNWEIALQPGLAWQLIDDGAWTRASVPFALQERSANCTHNGVLTWLFKDREVSRVYYQVSSETCAYFKFDTWGIAAASYSLADLEEPAAAVVARMNNHLDAQLPVKPLAALKENYPAVAETKFGIADGAPATDITVLGMVADGVHYRGDCATRHGPYPYCADLALPSYSTAKSIFASVATMRLELLHPGVSQRAIASLVDECDRRQWRGVTIEHALDMATGNYRSPVFNADEDAPPSIEFLESDSHDDKIRYACTYFKRRSKPGEQFVYHTSDTYLIGAALTAFVAEASGGADLYDTTIVQPLWRKLRLSPLLDTTKRTYDVHGMPFTGYGLTFTADDIARVAVWLAGDKGRIDGNPMLDGKMLDAALQRTAGDRGVEASPELRYNNGFWAVDAAPIIGCRNAAWVPFMSGYGGITVAMFPNGVVYYYFSDSNVFSWASAMQAAHSIANMCT